MKNETILVIGASGTVGSELVRLLKAEGHNVRTTTSKEPQSANAVKVDIATGEGIHKAFEGVDKAFLLSPPGYADHYKMLSPLIQEAKRRGLKKVVLMTAMGANAVETSPFRRAEIELEKSGLNYNIVRPNWFMQNFHTFWLNGIQRFGKILLPAGQAKTSFIDAKDISAVIAKLLTTTQFDNKDFDITGPESLDHSQVAATLSKVSGKKIVFEDISAKDFLAGLYSAGLPRDYADFLGLIMGFLKEGYAERRTENVKLILGREPRSIQTYAEENKSAWV